MRTDTYLFEKGFFESREKAKKAIEQLRIVVNGKTVTKPSFDIEDSDEIVVIPSERTEYVGRGGIKLEHALDTYRIDV